MCDLFWIPLQSCVFVIWLQISFQFRRSCHSWHKELCTHILLSLPSSVCLLDVQVPVFRCYYVCILYRFWDIQRQIMVWPWNIGYGSFKVIEDGTIRKLGYSFLCAFHSNHGSILYHFRDKARNWPKIAIFHTTPFLHSTSSLPGPRRTIAIPFGVEKLEWCSWLNISSNCRLTVWWYV